MVCLGIFTPWDHQKVIPFPLWLLRMMSHQDRLCPQALSHPRHCSQEKFYGWGGLSDLQFCHKKTKRMLVGISHGEGTGGDPAAKGAARGSAKPPESPPHPGW